MTTAATCTQGLRSLQVHSPATLGVPVDSIWTYTRCPWAMPVMTRPFCSTRCCETPPAAINVRAAWTKGAPNRWFHRACEAVSPDAAESLGIRREVLRVGKRAK